jgi:hypothetical protein
MLQEFEQKFLVKYQDSLRQSLAPYLQSLETIKETFDTEHLTAPSDEKIHIFSQQISKQIKVVHAILYATTLEEIMENIPNYLYLKQQLV